MKECKSSNSEYEIKKDHSINEYGVRDSHEINMSEIFKIVKRMEKNDVISLQVISFDEF